MSNVPDYEVNTRFKLGRMASPKERTSHHYSQAPNNAGTATNTTNTTNTNTSTAHSNDDSAPTLISVNQNVDSNRYDNMLSPRTVAPATMRMMGKQQQQQQQQQTRNYDSNTQGLMPPVNIPNMLPAYERPGPGSVNSQNRNYNYNYGNAGALGGSNRQTSHQQRDSNSNNSNNNNNNVPLSLDTKVADPVPSEQETEERQQDLQFAKQRERERQEEQRQQDQTQAQGARPPPVHEIKQFHRKALGDWDFLETVGAGSMGKVKLAKHHQTNEVCAIKIVNRATKAFLYKEQTLPPPKNEQEVLERRKKLEKEINRDKRTIREASLGQVLYHPHICRLFEMCTMSNHFYMLFEYVSGGQLLDYIIQHGSLREHHARKFARGIASALQYLHANNIVHRDLKIENIMISTSGEIKIIDFGLSNVFDKRKLLHTFCGSLYFAAPELLRATPYVGPEVDIWSFGVVLYVLVCGKVPFDDENSSVLHEKIKQGKVDYPNHLSIEVISLLSKMLVVDPSKRASLKQVVAHPWMNRGYDYMAPSYLPKRIPLTPGMIDLDVIKEMFRLEFVDNIEDTRAVLSKIITEEDYLELSQKFWTSLSNLKPERKLVPQMSNSHVSPSSPMSSGAQFQFPNPSSNVHYQEYTTNSNSNSNSISNSVSINDINSIIPNNFEDPTQCYHPLLSMYYLVSEMIARKQAKLERGQAQQQAQRVRQQQLQQQQSQGITVKKKLEDSLRVVPNNIPPSNINDNNLAGVDRTPAPNVVPQMFKSPVPAAGQNYHVNSPMRVPSLKSPLKPPPVMDPRKPLHVIVPPRLLVPEQAYTSPTNKKNLDLMISPRTAVQEKVLQTNPAYMQQQQQQQQQQQYRSQKGVGATDEVQEKTSAFGGIFRRLSQRRNAPGTNKVTEDSPTPQTPSHPHVRPQQQGQPQQLHPAQYLAQGQAPEEFLRQPLKKTHGRTLSEYVPNSARPHPSYIPASYVPNAAAFGATPSGREARLVSPSRSASTKVPRGMDFPALPTNAEVILQQQREKQLEQDMVNLKVNENADKEEQDFMGYDESNPLPPLNIVKGRKFHPNARAKSVGHARRESLKYSRPPVPTLPQQPELVEDRGFLEEIDDSKSEDNQGMVPVDDSSKNTTLQAVNNLEENEAGTSNNSGATATTAVAPPRIIVSHGDRRTSITQTPVEEPEYLTDEQIIEQASKAPPGSMPSIDYPRSLFLKGFFSVQTTSSKPLPIVRYKIIQVLRSMHIQFKEVKGGFICIQKAPFMFEDSPGSGGYSNQDDQYSGSPPPQSPSPSHQQDNRSLLSRTLSIQSSVRRRASLKYSQPGVPTTPMAASTHDKNYTPMQSPHRVIDVANAGNISNELSSTSIGELSNSQFEDVLTTSKVQVMNNEDSNPSAPTRSVVSSKDRPPIKFEIHIVKVRIVGLAGVHFKKVSGNTWLYKELASHILKELNL